MRRIKQTGIIAFFVIFSLLSTVHMRFDEMFISQLPVGDLNDYIGFVASGDVGITKNPLNIPAGTVQVLQTIVAQSYGANLLKNSAIVNPWFKGTCVNSNTNWPCRAAYVQEQINTQLGANWLTVVETGCPNLGHNKALILYVGGVNYYFWNETTNQSSNNQQTTKSDDDDDGSFTIAKFLKKKEPIFWNIKDNEIDFLTTNQVTQWGVNFDQVGLSESDLNIFKTIIAQAYGANLITDTALVTQCWQGTCVNSNTNWICKQKYIQEQLDANFPGQNWYSASDATYMNIGKHSSAVYFYVGGAHFFFWK